MHAVAARSRWFPFALLLTLAAPGQEPTAADTAAAMRRALAGEPATFADETFTAADTAAVRERMWSAYRAAATTLGHDAVLAVSAAAEAAPGLLPGTLACPPETMPYFLVRKGERPAAGWPLFFQMHGGGSTDDKLSGPHGWEVNTHDWHVQLKVVDRLLPDGLYFVPRMANDNRGRWWMRHNQVAFDRVLRCALLYLDVDPTRLYLMGISEGAYGTEALLPFFADRFAGGCSMAGGSGPGERFRNLLHTALRNDVGENDTMFGRVTLATQQQAMLDELQAADPTGFPHQLNVQQGRGHGIDYRPGPKWLAERRRVARPTALYWYGFALDGERRRDFGWLGLTALPEQDTWITARIDRATGSMAITAQMNPAGQSESPVYAAPRLLVERQPLTGGQLIVWLDDDLLDLDRDVTITLNGERAFAGRVRRSSAVVADTTVRFGDPLRVFAARIELPLPQPGGQGR